jgi:hypothetical protein
MKWFAHRNLAMTRFKFFLVFFTFVQAAVLHGQSTVFHYRVFAIDAVGLPTVPNIGGGLPGRAVGNFINLFSADVPTIGIPPGAGNRSLVGAGDANSEGVNSGAPQELLNATVIANGGFSFECWFKWFGGGNVNSIIDYAGTEKFRLRSGNLDMNFDSGSGAHLLEFAPTVNEWHYVAMVFEHDGNPAAGGKINGTMTWYYDSNVAVGSVATTKDDFGDTLGRVIGVGRHPLGFGGDHFDGLVFEPRVSLGALASSQLLFNLGPARDPEISAGTAISYGVFSAVPGPVHETLQVRNLGATNSLLLSNAQLTGRGAAAYSITNFPASIGPLASDNIEITFDPAAGGDFPAVLTFNTNDTQFKTFTVALSALVRDPEIFIDARLPFGAFGNNPGPQLASMFVDNFGAGTALTLSNPQLSGPGAANYAVTTLPGSIPPSGSDLLDVTFDPGAGAGFFLALLTLDTNDHITPTVTIVLSALVAGAIDLEGPSKLSHWTFDDPGNLGDDSGGLDYDGTVNGDAQPAPSSAVGPGALLLDGDQDFIEIPQGAYLYSEMGTDGDGFTIATWVCSFSGPSPHARQRYFSKLFDTGGGGIGVGQNNDIQLIATTYGVFDYFGATNPIQDEWHHVAYVFRGSAPSSVDYYLDGVLAATTVGNIGINSGLGTYAIGGFGAGAGEWFDGLLDDLRVYAVELSDPDLATLAAMGTPGPKGGGPAIEITLVEETSPGRLTIVFEGAPNTLHEVKSSPDLSATPFTGAVNIAADGLTTTGLGAGFVEIDISGSAELFFQIQQP